MSVLQLRNTCPKWNWLTAGIVVCVIGVVALIPHVAQSVMTNRIDDMKRFVIAPSPWQSVGGCGAGGGGGGSIGGVASAPWLGKGIQGGFLDVEIRLAHGVTTSPGGGLALLNTTSIPLTLAFHPAFMDMSLTLPLVLKMGQVRSTGAVQTGGIGDAGLSLSKRFGMSGQVRVNFGVGLPTGNFFVHDFEHNYLPSDMQLGAGVFGTNAGFDWTVDREWGMWVLGASYATGLLYLERRTAQWDEENQRIDPTRYRVSWAHTGALTYINDMGLTSGDNVSAHVHAGIKGSKISHSLGLGGAFPLSNSRQTTFRNISDKWYADTFWVDQYPDHRQVRDTIMARIMEYPEENEIKKGDIVSCDVQSYKVGDRTMWKYVQRTSRSQKQWVSLTLNYGMEIFNPELPLFWAISLPVLFDLDNGIGVSGFAVELGLKYRIR